MGEWDDYLKQYLTAEATHSDGKSRLAVAAALGARDQGGVFYAASGMETDGWDMCYTEGEYDADIPQEDGTDKKMKIAEAATVMTTLGRDEALQPSDPIGLWLGGTKYKATKITDAYEVGEGKSCKHIACAAPGGKGCHILITPVSFLVTFFDEKKGVSSGNCLQGAGTFADYLLGQGL